MHRITKREKLLNILVHAVIVAFFLFFFIKVCPLTVFDVDDWINLGNFRLPVPIWKGGEPTRVFPETLMPVAGWLAARIIYPICGDYVYSVTIVSAIFITFMITVMCVCLQKLLTERFQLALSTVVACETLFIILFFLIFRNRGTSACMFTAADLCCIYFYTMSGILNAIIILIFLRFNDMTESFLAWNYVQKTLFIIAVYFALFSNLFHSAITAIYAGVHLMISLWDNRHNFVHNLKHIFGENSIFLFVLAMWGVVLLFEANGGRAAIVGAGASLDFVRPIRQFVTLIRAFSRPFVMIMVLLFTMTLFHIYREHLFKQLAIVRIFVVIICNEILLITFLLLLNAKVAYMSRIDATWGIWFYLITMIVIATAYMVNEFALMYKLLPAVLLLLIFASVYPDGKFLMSTRGNMDYQTCVQLDHYVINSIMEASQEGMAEVTIRIPDHSDDLRSLAYNEQIGSSVADCLYTHGIIGSKLEVQTIVDKTLDDELEIFINE